MNAVRLVSRQVRFEQRSFRRNPPAAFFTVVFPLMFLVLFNLLFGDNQIAVGGGTTSASTFYVPAIAALAIISSCYTNIAISVSLTRDLGVLKRLRATPLPPWAYLAGVIGHVTLLSVLLVVVIVVAGALFYGVDVPGRTLPALAASVIVGAAAFSALGLALSGLIRDADGAPAIVNATVLPLLFISDVFVTPGTAPEWLTAIAEVFPIKHLSAALFAAFDPLEAGSGFAPGDLAVVAAWGLLGVAVALRWFRWEPAR
ncbi:MAG: ABC transporter permease [Chloroflexi bacterium]|nr:ABC transporter permease [Chloroflexota bacterium]